MKHNAFSMIPKTNDKSPQGEQSTFPWPKKARMFLYQGCSSIWIHPTRPKRQPSLLCWNIETVTWGYVQKRAWTLTQWLELYHNNALAHKVLSLKQFLPQKSITEREKPLCSPDLAPNDFCFKGMKISEYWKHPKEIW